MEELLKVNSSVDFNTTPMEEPKPICLDKEKDIVAYIGGFILFSANRDGVNSGIGIYIPIPELE